MTETHISESGFNRFAKAAETLKAAVSLADYCHDRGVVLKPAGRSLVGLCPLHPERTPSFNVYPDGYFK